MSNSIEQRVALAADEILAEQQHVGAVDVLNWIGWLPAPRIDEWRQGRVECLEPTMQVRPEKIPKALQALQRWAQDRGLVAAEIEYVARTRDRRPLRFSVSGDADVERAYRTHWTSPELSEPQRDRLVERQSTPPELVVIMPLKDWSARRAAAPMTCCSCRTRDRCAWCARPSITWFICPGATAGLTRRAHRASELSAVVVQFSRTRKRYERQGLLVELDALAAAERD